jgi:Glycosyltransferase
MHHYMRWPYGKCDRVFVPSEATRELLVRGHIAPSKIDIWRRGVETARFDPARRSASLRASWGVSNDRPALLYVGRVSREKGCPSSNRSRTLSMHPARLIDWSSWAMVRCSASFATDAPTPSSPGTLATDDVAVAMASSDLFVFPSRTDTAGNVVLEAQASGLAVLVSDAGGPCENIRAGQSGFVCSAFEDFASSAIDLLRNPSLRRRMGEGARQYALTRSWAAALDPLYRAYADVQVAGASEPIGAPAAA